MLQMFSDAQCTAANLIKTEYTAEDECVLTPDIPNKFSKLTCNSSIASKSYYDDKNCQTPCTAGTCQSLTDQYIPSGTCQSVPPGDLSAKATCGSMGEAIKIEQKIYSDSACASLIGSMPIYMPEGCNKMYPEFSMMLAVDDTKVKMDYYESVDCTGETDNPPGQPSEMTCNVCMPLGSQFRKICSDTCGCEASAGTRSSPLVLVAIAVIAFLAQ